MQRRPAPPMLSTTRSFAAAHTMLFIRVYDGAGNVSEMHEHTGEFKRGLRSRLRPKTGRQK
jgi:hypothetical protein